MFNYKLSTEIVIKYMELYHARVVMNMFHLQNHLFVLAVNYTVSKYKYVHCHV